MERPARWFPEEVEVEFVETLMGEAIAEPDRRRQRGCALGRAGDLCVVLRGAPCVHLAERQGTVAVFASVESRSAAYGDDSAYLGEAVDRSVELCGEFLGAAHAVGAGASNSQG